MTNEIKKMSTAVKCLALELPEPVWNDVNEKWNALLNALKPIKIDHVDKSTLPKGECLLLSTSKVWYIGDYYDGIWRVTGFNYWEFDMEAGIDKLRSKLGLSDITHWMSLPQTA